MAFFADFFFASDFFFGNDFFFAAGFFGAALLTVFFLAEGALLAADFFRVGFFLLTVFFLRAGFFLAMKKVYQTPTDRALLLQNPITMPSRSHSARLLLSRRFPLIAFFPAFTLRMARAQQGRNW